MTDVAALIRRLRWQAPDNVAIQDACTALERYQRLLTAAQAWRDAHDGQPRAYFVSDQALLAAIEDASK